MKIESAGLERAVVLSSGGLDSTVAIALARADHALEAALFFDYGQHAARREERSVRALAAHYGLAFEMIELPWLARISGSSLIAGKGMPPAVDEARLDEADGGSAPREVWVENRNGVFVAIAAAVAAARGWRSVIVGFNREEARSFADNSAAFIERTNEALALGTSNAVRVESPTIAMTKRRIVEEGLRLGVPWELIWSCYRGGAVQCGECESCARLERAVRGTAAARRIGFAKGDR